MPKICCSAVLLAAIVAAEYKTNHHFVRCGSSPEVKMSESKVRLQMVNVKYNYFRLHALYDGNSTTPFYLFVHLQQNHDSIIFFKHNNELSFYYH